MHTQAENVPIQFLADFLEDDGDGMPALALRPRSDAPAATVTAVNLRRGGGGGSLAATRAVPSLFHGSYPPVYIDGKGGLGGEGCNRRANVRGDMGPFAGESEAIGRLSDVRSAAVFI
jgi:hypothetical protein